jgi:hypothetical protein
VIKCSICRSFDFHPIWTIDSSYRTSDFQSLEHLIIHLEKSLCSFFSLCFALSRNGSRFQLFSENLRRLEIDEVTIDVAVNGSIGTTKNTTMLNPGKFAPTGRWNSLPQDVESRTWGATKDLITTGLKSFPYVFYCRRVLVCFFCCFSFHFQSVFFMSAIGIRVEWIRSIFLINSCYVAWLYRL